VDIRGTGNQGTQGGGLRIEGRRRIEIKVHEKKSTKSIFALYKKYKRT
jgi:hypothetical protein